MQMMLYPSTGELVLEDSPHVLQSRKIDTGEIVVVDITTGEERGRAPLNEKGTMGMVRRRSCQKNALRAGHCVPSVVVIALTVERLLPR